MRHFYSTIIIIVFSFLSETDAIAYTFKVDNIYYETINDTKVKVVNGYYPYSYSSEVLGKELEIPRIVNDYLVVAIGDKAFQYSNIEKIILPESITTIGKEAFKGSGIISIYLPDNLTFIGEMAFAECTKLGNITIPDGVTSIGERTFKKSGIQTIYIPDKVKTIPYEAFAHCKNLHTISGCLGVLNIDGNAFAGCSELINFNIPQNLEELGSGAFQDCIKISSIEIPSTVSTISDRAFQGCSELRNVKISEGVKYIAVFAFDRCISLTEIYIPASVTGISGSLITSDSTPFQYCSNLTSIIVDKDNPYYDSRDNCNAIISKTDDMLFVGCNTTKIPQSVRKIGNAFYGCIIHSLQIPLGVEDIWWRAFEDSYLGEISVEEGNSAFDSRNNCNTLIDTKTNEIRAVSSKTFIPKDIESISEVYFSMYPDIQALYCYAPNPPKLRFSPHFTNNQYKNMTLFVPIGCKNKYESTDEWNNFWNIKEFDPTGGIFAPIKKGDANGDNIVNATDIMEVQNYIMGNPSKIFNKTAADANDDGVVNAADIVLIINAIKETE